LLILTQKIDKNDDVLGFMHGWVSEFAKKFNEITVITLGVGEYDLPKNVKVLSLGKESSRSRIKYIFKFYKYIWQERKNYDAVFVHMNREYMILGGWLWKIWRKKTIFWYNHKRGNLMSLLAGFFANKICYTSPYSFFARKKWNKAKKMSAGIDTERFKKMPEVKKIKNSILCLGRISKVKNVDVLIDVAKMLDNEGYDFIIDIYGEGIESESDYLPKLKEQAKLLINKGKVRFLGKISNTDAPKIFNQYELYVNLTNSGSYDKTILEAMACELSVIVSNRSFEGVLLDSSIFKEKDARDLAKKTLVFMKDKNIQNKEMLRTYVIQDQSLKKLLSGLKEYYEIS